MAQVFVESFDVTCPPASVASHILQIAIKENWFTEKTWAAEYAESIKDAVYRHLCRDLDTRIRNGQPTRYALNSSSPYLIQGSSYIEPIDQPQVIESKTRRTRTDEYQDLLKSLSPREFEAACRGVLVLMGATETRLTRSSNDQGIDFWGRLNLKGKLAVASELPGVDHRLSVWLVGQAKHYQKTKVATPDIRELVGSIELAKARTYSDPGEALKGLNIAVCDPVFYLFFTTGEISVDGWMLMQRSGVIGLDGVSLSALLADAEVGISDGVVDKGGFNGWIQENMR